MSFGWSVDSEEALQEILRQNGSDVTIRAEAVPAPAQPVTTVTAGTLFDDDAEAAPAPAPRKRGRPKSERKAPRPDRMSEHDHQVALFERLAAVADDYPEVSLLFAIPNGAKLPYGRTKDGERFSRQGAILKAEGLKAGVPDMFLPVSRPFRLRAPGARSITWHGLFIELKREKGKLQDSQREWLYFLRQQGYACVVAFGHAEAFEAIIAYLEGRLGPADLSTE